MAQYWLQLFSPQLTVCVCGRMYQQKTQRPVTSAGPNHRRQHSGPHKKWKSGSVYCKTSSNPNKTRHRWSDSQCVQTYCLLSLVIIITLSHHSICSHRPTHMLYVTCCPGVAICSTDFVTTGKSSGFSVPSHNSPKYSNQEEVTLLLLWWRAWWLVFGVVSCCRILTRPLSLLDTVWFCWCIFSSGVVTPFQGLCQWFRVSTHLQASFWGLFSWYRGWRRYIQGCSFCSVVCGMAGYK